ncbi:hypothetical protein NPIL_656731 [Nephila pilipes]|uniref:Uncharacterized protein n=1 Tax=Nephila pilipes TaxID=299642 RepID=A0A8X6IXA5_NEPPI|nr:hypothetical protein NPIL_656731 [Nephila pilipes]
MPFGDTSARGNSKLHRRKCTYSFEKRKHKFREKYGMAKRQNGRSEPTEKTAAKFSWPEKRSRMRRELDAIERRKFYYNERRAKLIEREDAFSLTQGHNTAARCTAKVKCLLASLTSGRKETCGLTHGQP